MPKSDEARRKCCETCERPQSVCLCPWLVEVASQTPLRIFRHPDEAKHALNTAKLLAAMCSSCQLIDGELFEPEEAVLVYPGDDSIPLSELPPSNAPRTFILLDGTWRKTRKLLQLNPWLAELPQVRVETPPSRYVLRKAKPEGVSTLEAAVALFAALEPETNTRPLLAALDQLMTFQREAMGEERFQKDFGSRLNDTPKT